MRKLMLTIAMTMMSCWLFAAGGFTVTQYNLTVRPLSISDAKEYIKDSSKWDGSPKTGTYTTISFANLEQSTTSEGKPCTPNFSTVSFPGNIGGKHDWFAVEVDGDIKIPTTGYWTFACGSDDGFEATISGHDITYSFSYSRGRWYDTDVKPFYFSQAGIYHVKIYFFDYHINATLDFSVAQGSHSEFNSTTFKLVNAVANCFTISFNANGGVGDRMEGQLFESGNKQKLSKNTYRKDGYVFQGWAKSKADADNGIVKFRDEVEIAIDYDMTLYAVWTVISSTPDVVVHFNANGGVFRDKDGNEVTQFDQYFTYGEAQRLFTDELTPMKIDAKGNANHFLGWVCGSSAMASSAYLVDYLIDGRAMKTWDDDVSEVTLYAVWTATLTISYYNRSDYTLSPSSLADHLTWRTGSPDSPTTGKSGEPVQIWPGTPNIYLLIDDDYKWVAGQIKFVGRYGVANPYYDSSMCALHNIEIRGGQEYSIDVEVGPSQEFSLEGEVVFWHSCAVREELRNLINSQRGNLPDFDPSKVRISIGRAEFNPAGNDYVQAKTGELTGLELYKFYWLPVGFYYLKDVTYDTDTSSGDPYWGALLGPISARLIKSRLIQVRNDDDEVITEYTINFDVFGDANVARAIFDSREGECTKSEAWFPNAAEGIRVVSEKALPTPKRPGFDFIGWFTKKDGGIKLREGAVIPGNKVHWNIPDSIDAFDHTFTVYAQWTNMTDEWVNELFPELVFDLNVDVATIATTTAANGKLTVAQCYSCGVNPKDPDDDLKITDFEIKDGKPVITLNHTEDGSGNSFLPRVKTLGKATLSDAEEWREVPEEGDPSMRFFKVEVEMP